MYKRGELYNKNLTQYKRYLKVNYGQQRTLLLNEKITTVLIRLILYKKIRVFLVETGMLNQSEVKYFCLRAKMNFL